MFIVFYKFRDVIFRRHKAHGTGLCEFVTRPGAAVELILESDDTGVQIGIGKRAALLPWILQIRYSKSSFFFIKSARFLWMIPFLR